MKNRVSQVLDGAKFTVLNDRGKTHGDVEDSFTMIADLWSVYLKNVLGVGVALLPYHVAMMMDLLKTARATHGRAAMDHFVDKAGYSSLAFALAPYAEEHTPSEIAEESRPSPDATPAVTHGSAILARAAVLKPRVDNEIETANKSALESLIRELGTEN